MAMMEYSRNRSRFAPRCWSAVILLAICSLTMSLATRFTVVGPDVQKIASTKADLTSAKRQNLLGNALQWSAPIAHFSLFEPPRSAVSAVSVIIPPTNLTSETWLYNRPPPAC
jgi:hypothetical protein